MSEDWAGIAIEAAAALAEVGFAATLERTSGGATTPWGAETATATTYAVTVIDTGIKDRYIAGSLITRQVRVLLIGATVVAPVKSDRIQVRGEWFDIEAVMPLAPGGVDLLYDVEIAK